MDVHMYMCIRIPMLIHYPTLTLINIVKIKQNENVLKYVHMYVYMYYMFMLA